MRDDKCVSNASGAINFTFRDLGSTPSDQSIGLHRDNFLPFKKGLSSINMQPNLAKMFNGYFVYEFRCQAK